MLRELGPPHSLSALPDGCVFLYEHSHIRERQIGISLSSINIPVIKLIKTDSTLVDSDHILFFDRHGVLRADQSLSWDESLGGGQAMQWVTSVISLTDTGSFRRTHPAFDWGSARLRPAPVVLNSGQDLRSGKHGLQQHNAPKHVGQSTLEMPSGNDSGNRFDRNRR